MESISSIRIAISTLSKKYREKHPEMKSLLQQLQESQSELDYAISNVVSNINASFLEAKDNFAQAQPKGL